MLKFNIFKISIIVLSFTGKIAGYNTPYRNATSQPQKTIIDTLDGIKSSLHMTSHRCPEQRKLSLFLEINKRLNRQKYFPVGDDEMQLAERELGLRYACAVCFFGFSRKDGIIEHINSFAKADNSNFLQYSLPIFLESNIAYELARNCAGVTTPARHDLAECEFNKGCSCFEHIKFGLKSDKIDPLESSVERVRLREVANNSATAALMPQNSTPVRVGRSSSSWRQSNQHESIVFNRGVPSGLLIESRAPIIGSRMVESGAPRAQQPKRVHFDTPVQNPVSTQALAYRTQPVRVYSVDNSSNNRPAPASAAAASSSSLAAHPTQQDVEDRELAKLLARLRGNS